MKRLYSVFGRLYYSCQKKFQPLCHIIFYTHQFQFIVIQVFILFKEIRQIQERFLQNTGTDQVKCNQ